MILSSATEIDRYTARGWWGTDSIDDEFRRAVSEAPQRTAVVDPPNRRDFTSGAAGRLDYAGLDELVDRLAARLLQAGLAKDEILVVQLPNIIESLAVLLAGLRIGAIISPVPVQYREHELTQILGILEARAVVTAPRIAGFEHAEMALRLARRVRSVRCVLVIGNAAPDGAAGIEPLPAPEEARERLARHRAKCAVDANEVATICWTSGTEARPKAVPRSHNQWLAIGRLCQQAASLQDGESILNPFPMVNMASIGGMVLPWMLARGKLVQHQPFDPTIYLEQIAAERINFTIAPPAVLNRLIKQPELLDGNDLSSLRAIGSGSAPLSPWMVKAWEDERGIIIVNYFGSNEGTCLFATGADVPDPMHRAQLFPRFGVAGYRWSVPAATWTQTRLVDIDTGEVIAEPGRPGELRLKGPTVFSGYYRDPEASAAAFDDEKFFRTGDTFEIAGHGELERYYRFVGRSKELIIRGGMNISPGELDTLIDSHPKIREAAVVGIPDPILGERVCAVVVPGEGQTIELPELVSYLREKNIAVFKLPEKLVVADALPRNPIGKVLRAALAELAAGDKERE